MPATLPVKNPKVGSIVTTLVRLLVHVPPGVALYIVSGSPGQIEKKPPVTGVLNPSVTLMPVTNVNPEPQAEEGVV